MSYRSPLLLLLVLLLPLFAGCDSTGDNSGVAGVWFTSDETRELFLVITDTRFAWYGKPTSATCFIDAKSEIDGVEGNVYTFVLARLESRGETEERKVVAKYRVERDGAGLVVTDLRNGDAVHYEKSDTLEMEIKPICDFSIPSAFGD